LKIGLLTTSESILEDLLKAQKFEDREVDSGVQSEAALVRTKCRVELNTVSAVHLDLSFVVLPCDTELDDPLWDGSNLESCLVLWVLLEKTGMFEGGGKLWS
jgi:hypothetical protein